MMAKAVTRTLVAKASVLLIVAMAILALLSDDLSAPLLHRYQKIRRRRGLTVHVPASLDDQSQRALTEDLGGGNCKWGPPTYDVPEEIDFHKTLIAGYPSGDKRMIFVQMEALTGWPAKDEWDFEYLGDSNHPFIKANYPHHEGVWGWGTNADQVVLMVRNMRRSMVEYYDIRWDLQYAESYDEVAALDLDQLYGERAPLEDFLVWRDDKVMDEIYWYGWEIDYWMEGGLMRDMFSHGITTPEHFAMEMNPRTHQRAELEEYYADNVAPGVLDGTITPTYDAPCANGFVTDGCEPVAVISAEKLRDPARGPAETEAIADVLLRDGRMSQYVANPSIFRCVWRELIVNKKGLKTVYDRTGRTEYDYNFSEEMLSSMIAELDRLIAKYSSAEWNTKATANTVVELLTEHRGEIREELEDVQAGRRTLTEKDFLGPRERQRRLDLDKRAEGGAARDRKDYSAYFVALERKVWDIRQEARRLAVKEKLELGKAKVKQIEQTVERIEMMVEKARPSQAASPE